MKQYQYTIRPDGTVKIEVFNGTGVDCEEATRVIEGRLGDPVGQRTRKSEYHETEQQTEHTREHEGGS